MARHEFCFLIVVSIRFEGIKKPHLHVGVIVGSPVRRGEGWLVALCDCIDRYSVLFMALGNIVIIFNG